MQSGRETLDSIDQALSQVRRHGEELDAQIQQVGADLLRLGQREAEKYKELAKVRLQEMKAGELVTGLDHVQLQVEELLGERDGQLEALLGRIKASEQAGDELQSQRAKQERRVAKAVERLDKAEAGTQKRLQETSAHREQLAKAHEADSIAARAEEKTQQADTDRIEKGKPYESDPLFMYLWKRSYGTSGYSAFPLFRLLDDKVARLCRYQAARPNYAMLLEIPRRLAEHAERVRGAADKEFEALEAIEEKAAGDDGIPALREAVDQAERKLDEIDERIREAEEQNRQLIQQRADFADGSDGLFRRASDMLRAEFRRDGIMSLIQQAARTPSRRDDLLVQELADIMDEKERLEDALAQHRQMHSRHIQRVQDLERVRREFKQQRYDDVHSTFGNEQLIVGILNEFLRGVASSGDLWGTLRRHHRRRRIESDPDFGTGGFGRSESVWRMPSSREGGGFGRRGGGGGFRTGGGF